MDDSPGGLTARLKELRLEVEAALAKYLLLGEDYQARLTESMSYSLMAGGKRLRPVLVLLACEACGGTIESAMPAACAIEMIHTYSLIHDDLPAMDDDDLRRGRPTNHVVYGDAMAILAGDALLTLAFEVIGRDVRPGEVAAACCVDLANAAGASGMVGGQVADLEAENQPPDLEALRNIHRRKTGRLLCSALTLGGRVAGAPGEWIECLKSYGERLGLAFQITDDLLDIQGDQTKLGKSIGKDTEQGKMTYPALMGMEKSRQTAEELIKQAIDSVEPLGESAQALRGLARFVLERDH